MLASPTEKGIEMSTGNHESKDHKTEGNESGTHSQRRMYLLFVAMIVTSTTVMFLLTYTNNFSIDHVRWSEERLYMALLMGSTMAIIMLSFMWAMMYRNVKVNIAIILVALVLGGSALGLSRSQVLVDDVAYMDGMIPHHSIAILTSTRANLDDVRVRKLADGIIDAQEKEIAQMKWLVDDIAANGKATTQEEAEVRPVPAF